MTRCTAVVAIAMLLLTRGTATAQEVPPPNDPNALLPERIDQAIQSGVSWLKARATPEGGFGPIVPDPRGGTYGGAEGKSHRFPTGPTALALHTLLRCGVPADDPVIQKGFQWLREKAPPPNSSYEISILILALESLHDPKLQPTSDPEAEPPPSRRKGDPEVKLPSKDRAWMKRLIVDLFSRRQQDKGWRYSVRDPRTKELYDPPVPLDMCSTGLAVHALFAAERCGFPQPEAAYRETLEWTLDIQQKEGPPVDRPTAEGEGEEWSNGEPVRDQARGWAYQPGSPIPWERDATGTMTTSALASIAICSRFLKIRKDKRFEKTLGDRAETGWSDGIAWISKNWDVTRNPYGSYKYYHLWGLERVAGLQGIMQLAGHDWYMEGAKVAVREQRTGGFWQDDYSMGPTDLLGTCFALLFLSRSTRPLLPE